MLLAVFCLRLAAGLLGCLLLLSPDVGPAPTAASRFTRVGFRFYRTHFLAGLLVLLAAALGLAVAGSVVWALEGAPGGRALVILTTAVLAAGLVWLEMLGDGAIPLASRLVGDLTSAALVGS